MTLRTNVALGAAALALAASASPSLAGISVLVADRTAHKIWRLTDINNDGIISPNEVFVWFDETNAAGTPGIGNLSAFNSRRSDNMVIGGDSSNHVYYAFQDLNNDGNAMGPGESRVIMTASNASGASVSAPTGIGFFGNGDLMVCNSGSASAPDAIYRLHDFNGDGTYDQPGEAAPWVVSWPAFGVGNSPYTPFEVVVGPGDVGYLHSSGTNNGVYKFADTSPVNGRADDAGEFLPWFNSSNQSGITVAAGFSLELDLVRPGSLYINQLAAGGVDQIIRLTDANANGSANDAGEATVVYSTGEASFTAQDILSLPIGDVLVSDVVGKRVIRLHDRDGDGLFTSPGERTDFFVAGARPGS